MGRLQKDQQQDGFQRWATEAMRGGDMAYMTYMA